MKKNRKTAKTKARRGGEGPPGFRSERRGFVIPGSVTATEAKNEFGRVFEEALDHGAIVITRHESPRAVVLAYDEYESLVGTNARKLDTLRAEFDAQYAQMQRPGFSARVRTALNAPAAELGKAALAAAKRNG